ncbi:hypothetical protein [Variovorax ginsengisoli]|uniref:Uncharacterized protein n=1 Tax=Variovorax ginsengisoli TaxID=363844 RepID=A0ABT8SB90_9BURK|nr:hypothetical protein [Variovorax ginsengisoli]MDN8617021.1 hypothetical protein [Variovorax ginsengisoli]MDO1536191.1 hypothetical protein [Variovorax ginsengisoli]
MQTLALGLLAGVWVFLGGSFGVTGLNSDWPKHFAVLNFLTANSSLYAGPDEILRYSIGWYIVPSVIAKVTGSHWQAALAGIWSAIGIFVFFRLLIDLVGGGKRALLAPVVFALFSGADIIGQALTGFHLGPRWHIEWWTGWVAYDSSTTSLFWVPQHAIAAWLMTALLLRQIERPTILPEVALLFAATQLWSPIVALGLVPFAGYLLFQPGGSVILRNWRTWASVFFVGLPTALYLTGASQALPASLQWNRACGDPFPCFTWPAYPRFLAVEILAFLLLLLAWKPARTGMFAVAAVTLLLIPLYSIGWANDFGMRASLPALAVVAIGAAALVIKAPPKLAGAMIAVLAIGVATPLSEIARGFVDQPAYDPTGDFTPVIQQEASVRPQYFAPPRDWLMRNSAPPLPAALGQTVTQTQK